MDAIHADSVTGAAVKLQKAYDSPPWWYDIRGYGILKLSYRCSLLFQIAYFERNLKERHLEVAIGSGTLFSMILARRRRRAKLPAVMKGIDYSPQMLSGAISRFAGRGDIELVQCDAARMPFDTGSFDSANIANALHAFPDIEAGLCEIQRILRPGGTLAVNVLLHPHGFWPLKRLALAVNAWAIRKGILHATYSESEVISHLNSAGFEVVQAFREGNTLFVLSTRK